MKKIPIAAHLTHPSIRYRRLTFHVDSSDSSRTRRRLRVKAREQGERERERVEIFKKFLENHFTSHFCFLYIESNLFFSNIFNQERENFRKTIDLRFVEAVSLEISNSYIITLQTSTKERRRVYHHTHTHTHTITSSQ